MTTPCESCGHDADRHRRGRCWTDWSGEPVHRARTQITCPCREVFFGAPAVVEPDDDELAASIARHPAGKGRRP